MVSKTFAGWALVTFSFVVLIGCSKADDTYLTGSPKPTAPPADTVGPGSADQTNDDGTSDDGAGDDRSSEQDQNNVPTKYRVICDERFPKYLSSVSSIAAPMGFGAELRVSVPNADGTFDPNGPMNLENHLSPQVVMIPAFGEARILFSAKTVNVADERKIYVSDTFVATRSGAATTLGREIAASVNLETVASREGLRLRTFGVSDRGSYLLIGRNDGYQILDSRTLRVLGSVKVGSAAATVNPALRESDMMFTASEVDGSFLQTKIFSLHTSPAGVVASSKSLGTVKGLRRPLVSVGPLPGESFAALDSKNRIRVVAVDGVGGSAAVRSQSFEVVNLPKSGALSSATAFWRDQVTGDLKATVAFENIRLERETASSRPLRYKIEQVFVRVLSLNESRVSVMTEDEFDYPMESRRVIELGFMSARRVSITDLRSSPDGREVFALFPGELFPEIYRMSGSSFVRVSQQACNAFSIGVEL